MKVSRQRLEEHITELLDREKATDELLAIPPDPNDKGRDNQVAISMHGHVGAGLEQLKNYRRKLMEKLMADRFADEIELEAGDF